MSPSREFVRAFFDNRFRELGVLAVALGPSGELWAWSESFAQLVAQGDGELAGRDYFRTFTDQAAATFHQATLAGSGATTEGDETLRVPRSERVVHWSTQVLRDAAGVVLGAIRIGWDVTERVERERALRARETHLLTMVEQTTDWLWEVDEATRYTYVGPQVKALLGYAPEELLGRTPFGLMPSDEASRVARCFDAAAKERRPFAGLKNVNLHRDGRRVMLETSGEPIFDASGRFRGYRGIDRDVTRRERVVALEGAAANLMAAVVDGIPPATALEKAASEIRHALGVGGVVLRTSLGSAASIAGVTTAAGPTASLELCFASRRLGEVELSDPPGAALCSELLADLEAAALDFAHALAAAEQQGKVRLLEAALESAANAVVIADREGRIQWVNQAFTLLTGYGREEVLGRTPRILKSGKQDDRFYQQIWETITSGRVWTGQLYNQKKNGCIYSEEMAITPVRGLADEITHFIAIKLDVTERDQALQELAYLSTHDPLTQLPNRGMLEQRLKRVVEIARRGRGGACLRVDLDHFKIVNDTVGYSAGDTLLKQVAANLRETLRPDDFMARLGGDEFVIVLEGLGLDEAQVVAERLRGSLTALRFEFEGYRFDVGASVGVVPVDGRLDAEGVMSLVDAAVFTAKQRGRNRIAVSEARGEEQSQAVQASGWAAQIREGLRENRCSLHYQPVIELSSGRVSYVEA